MTYHHLDRAITFAIFWLSEKLTEEFEPNKVTFNFFPFKLLSFRIYSNEVMYMFSFACCPSCIFMRVGKHRIKQLSNVFFAAYLEKPTSDLFFLYTYRVIF